MDPLVSNSEKILPYRDTQRRILAWLDRRTPVKTRATAMRVIQTFVGRSPARLLDKGRAESAQQGSVVMSWRPTRKLRDDLHDRGLAHVHEFSALPSLKRIRWLLPATAPLMLCGLQMYAPFSFRARFFKALLCGIARLGWTGWNRARVLVASHRPLPLEALVTEITGERRPTFALSFGNQENFRALTAQVMRPSGEVLGYIKLPLTSAAEERVRHEAKTLRYLWDHSPALRSHIPGVLYSGVWDEDFILFQSAGPSTPGPRRFSAMHSDFLRLLQQINPVEKTGSVIVEETATSWRRVEADLDRSWQTLGQEALHQADVLLRGRSLSCGVMHGDFAPWNTRQQDGLLFVFDWELAQWPSPNIWDVFRFHERVSMLLRQKHISYPRDLLTACERGLFLLYCLQSVCDAIEHGGCYLDVKLEYQKYQVFRCLDCVLQQGCAA